MMYSREALGQMKVKELLPIAKELNVVGRHDMRREQLIDAIVGNQAETSTSVVKSTRQHTNDIEQDLAHGKKSEWENANVQEACNVVDVPKPKERYLDNAKPGTIIAFKVGDSKVFSGMIKEIISNGFTVETRNGVKFTVRRSKVLWVKTGDRWPRGIYQALKGEVPVGELKAAN
ncbi:MAG: Rho termination factor N-terminal domain-containing protein [Clostridia bacterium]|nr:Rho termination factor N-terminal domain-containing protein [Clostridia bacterium]